MGTTTPPPPPNGKIPTFPVFFGGPLQRRGQRQGQCWIHDNHCYLAIVTRVTRVTLDSIRNSYNVLISRLGSTVTIFELPQVHKGSKNGHFCRQTSQFQVEQIFWFWLNLCRGRDGSNTESEAASGDAEVQGECGQVVRIESKLQSWASQKLLLREQWLKISLTWNTCIKWGMNSLCWISQCYCGDYYVAKPNMTLDLLHRLFILHFWKICDKLAHVRVKFVFSVINIIFSQDIIQLALENATNIPTYQPYRVDEQINNSELNAID